MAIAESPRGNAAGAEAVWRSLRATIDVYHASERNGGNGHPAGLDPAGVQEMLSVIADTAGMLEGMCSDLLGSPHTTGSPEHEHLQVAQDAAQALAQHCRWASRHVR